ncbi:MAG: MBL fold metallo-hydrolase [Caldilineaceae bacterium]
MERVFASPGNGPISAVYRLGNPYVNWYVVESDGGLLIIDSGLAGHWRQLLQGLEALEKSVHDVAHLLLTHAHPDHVGLAERMRRESNATVWIHALDADMATTNQDRPPLAPLLSGLWQPAVAKMIVMMMRDGVMNAKPVRDVRTFRDGDRLPIPGSPTAVHTPGHTPGSCAFYFQQDRLLFSGDALVTFDLLRARKSAPMLPPGREKAAMIHSLDGLGPIGDERVVLLPGHGEPWAGKVGEAVAGACA